MKHTEAFSTAIGAIETAIEIVDEQAESILDAYPVDTCKYS